jgi:hypothetical protein
MFKQLGSNVIVSEDCDGLFCTEEQSVSDIPNADRLSKCQSKKKLQTESEVQFVVFYYSFVDLPGLTGKLFQGIYQFLSRV